MIGKLKNRSVCMQSTFLLFCCCDEKSMQAKLSPSSTSTTMTGLWWFYSQSRHSSTEAGSQHFFRLWPCTCSGVCSRSLSTLGWFIWRTSTFRVSAPRPATYPASTSRALRHAKVRNSSLCKLPVLWLIMPTMKIWGDCTWTSREWQRISRDPKFQNLNDFGCLPGYQVNCI